VLGRAPYLNYFIHPKNLKLIRPVLDVINSPLLHMRSYNRIIPKGFKAFLNGNRSMYSADIEDSGTYKGCALQYLVLALFKFNQTKLLAGLPIFI